MKTKIQTCNKRIEIPKTKLDVEIIKFKEELTDLRTQLSDKKFSFEQMMKSFKS